MPSSTYLLLLRSASARCLRQPCLVSLFSLTIYRLPPTYSFSLPQIPDSRLLSPPLSHSCILLLVLCNPTRQPPTRVDHPSIGSPTYLHNPIHTSPAYLPTCLPTYLPTYCLILLLLDLHIVNLLLDHCHRDPLLSRRGDSLSSTSRVASGIVNSPIPPSCLVPAVSLVTSIEGPRLLSTSLTPNLLTFFSLI